VSILNDIEISRLAQAGMITPYVGSLVRELEVDEPGLRPYGNRFIRAISFGASSYGYDLRLSPKEFLIFRHIPGTVINP
jgi:dCTP deaminase